MYKYPCMPSNLNMSLKENLLYILNIPILRSSLPKSNVRPPLWSSGQSSWLQIRRPGFDSRALPDFLGKKMNTSSRSGTGCTQPREYN
jgi:hypothetical protein